jgi:hypothetical protein
MIDLNHRNPAGQINALIDAALVASNQRQPKRSYLGGSRLGHHCLRALQYEYFHAPKDDGRDFNGQTLRIFQIGHVLEDLAVKWFRQAGFDLRNEKQDGRQFGFSVMDGKIAGHIDGVFCGGPDVISYPALWECKTMNAKKWKACQKDGVRKSHPIYAAQVAIYQAYMQLTDNPAVFTFINKDTAELGHQIIEFDAELAQKTSDNGVRVITSAEAGELLPRIAKEPDYFECRWCDYHERCWNNG